LSSSEVFIKLWSAFQALECLSSSGVFIKL
jgi:hypothetical protein